MKSALEHGGKLMHYEFTDPMKTLETVHGRKFFEYRQAWNQACELMVPMEPLYILLETNSYCNLRCKMCAHSIYSAEHKENKSIPLELVDKLVDECKKLHVPSINVGASTECTINPQIRIILQKISTTGAIDKFLFTNGTKLDADFCNFLIDIGFERVYISLDAATPETYRKIRGYELEKVERNIQHLLEVKERKNSPLPIVRVSFVKQRENLDEVDAFVEKWKEKVNIIDFQELCDFSNLDALKDLPNVPYKCQGPFTSLNINCNGDIFPCCTFYAKYFRLGNLRDMSLHEAWTCEKMVALRNAILAGNLPKACRNCANAAVNSKEVL